MRTCIYHLTLAALASLAVPAAAPDYEASDYLPLAVGNSWTFDHDVYDRAVFMSEAGDAYPVTRLGDSSEWTAYVANAAGKTPELTITVERTEEIDGKTYYVMSSMPAFWPPAPPHCLSGKKVRWDGTRLVEHTGTGELTLFRFDGANAAGYSIPTTDGDNRVTVYIDLNSFLTESVPVYVFSFLGHDYGEWPAGIYESWSAGRGVWFMAGYGLAGCSEAIQASDHPSFINEFRPIQATLSDGGGDGVSGQSGTRVLQYKDVWEGRSTSSSSSSWGTVKGRGGP